MSLQLKQLSLSQVNSPFAKDHIYTNVNISNTYEIEIDENILMKISKFIFKCQKDQDPDRYS